MTNTERFKKFTILHSNDMHGDFLAEATGAAKDYVIGGMSLLSGYINKVRQEEKTYFLSFRVICSKALRLIPNTKVFQP